MVLARTTKDYLMTLNSISIGIVGSTEISISSHIGVTVLSNKLDNQRHQYLRLTEVILICLATSLHHRETVGEVISALWIVCGPEGIGSGVRKVSGILE
jgi:hypothetical protein